MGEFCGYDHHHQCHPYSSRVVVCYHMPSTLSSLSHYLTRSAILSRSYSYYYYYYYYYKPHFFQRLRELSGLAKVTQLVSGRVQIRTWAESSKAHLLNITLNYL